MAYKQMCTVCDLMYMYHGVFMCAWCYRRLDYCFSCSSAPSCICLRTALAFAALRSASAERNAWGDMIEWVVARMN